VTSRWNRFYLKQLEDEEMKQLVERELNSLKLGIQIARLRKQGKLTQTRLAALADMSAPKISALENEPQNLTIATLIRVAHALGTKVEIKLIPRKAGKQRTRRRSARAA
jgi:transcriptional regulator with XRE-family HTH domain